jgi:hypothetical protein
VDYVGEELYGLLGFNLGDGPSLDPFGELVDCYQEGCEAPGRFLQRYDEVQSPHGERPCDGDGLQSMGRKMRPTGIELATLASLHDLSGIGNCYGPVKTLPECIATRVHGAAWWPQTPAWMSRSSSLPSGMGMQHCRLPEGPCL